MITPRRVLTTLLLAALTPALVPAAALADASPVPGPVTSMASLGDSITRGFNACGFYLDCPSRSWSTGSASSVNSHYRRLQAANPSLIAYNDGKTGAKAADIPGQAQRAVSQGVDYVTILVGANDACTSSEASMTPVADYEAAFRTALRTLTTGLPNAAIFVTSVPDVKRLWEVGKGSSAARAAWATLDICQSLLERPRSTDQADVDRRDRVRARVADYNAVAARVCAEYVVCRTDGGAVFAYRFELSNVNTWDYFHPNTSGQRLLAELTYPADDR
ncbi:GDSL-type esterase/lipase family protein [Streptosporangium carneum]|uniref:Lipoprotein n=1 Tax=Streptosporangium carneum TaxID=47481 RepID=A0A9W6IBT4_9ACTN|nr:GDSL-type esterase/lipase family protein [Streptosporangium carneum]GLK14600.1 lipoprotein [Streptosporangium carneum]